jgi:subtilisin family serine protease
VTTRGRHTATSARMRAAAQEPPDSRFSFGPSPRSAARRSHAATGAAAVFVASLLAVGAAAAAQASPPRSGPERGLREDVAARQPRMRPGAVVMKLRPGGENALPARAAARASAVAQSALGALAAGKVEPLLRSAARAGAVGRAHGVFRVTLEPGADPLAASRRLAADPRVEYAEPAWEVHAAALPDDPYLASSGSWGQDYGDLWGLHQIGAPSAWDSGIGAGTLIAVVDTGVDAAHADLAANLWRNPAEHLNGLDDDGNGLVDDLGGWDFANADSDPADDNGHGTHVAGTAAAAGDDGAGILGVAWGAEVMALKALDATGNGWTDDIAAAVHYAVGEGADVINLSLGGYVTSQVLEDAVRAAHEAGVAVVAAAGNDATHAGQHHPCSSRWAICVAANDPAGAKAAFSNFGSVVDLTAPGGPAAGETTGPNILSVRAEGTSLAPYVLGPHLRLQGTSMAAPHVAGAAALLRGQAPDLDVESLRQMLRRGAAAGAGWGAGLGAGRLHLPGALAELAAGRGAARFTSPLPGAFASGEVAIEGIATAAEFASYRVDVAPSVTATTWSLIHEGFAPVEGGLLASWTPGPAGTPQVLRLTVWTTAGRSYVDYLDLTLQRVRMTSPREFDALRGGEAVTIRGTVAYPGLTRWEITTWDNGVPKSSQGFALANDGTAPVVDGVLATWDTSYITAPRYLMMTLAVFTDDPSRAVAHHNIRIFVDPELHTGWPKTMPLPLDASGFYQNGTLADLERDGRSEVLIADGGAVHAFRHDGSEPPGWPVHLPDGLRTTRSPASADLDGDGAVELVVTTHQGKVLVYGHDGVLRTKVAGTFGAHAALGDVSGDALPEIVVSGAAGAVAGVAVLDGDGNLLANGCLLPGRYGNPSIPGSPALADLDSDGKLDIVVAQRLGLVEVTACRGDGTALWPETVVVDVAPAHDFMVVDVPPVVGDLDGDGRLEVVAGSGECEIAVIDARGARWPGWPAEQRWPGAPRHCGHLAVADVDGEPGHEIVQAAQIWYHDAILSVVDAAGRALPGWPVAYGGESSSAGGPAVVDVDADGSPEILLGGAFATVGDKYALSAYHADGSPVAGFPRKTLGQQANWWGNTPTVADLDADGLLELLFTARVVTAQKDEALLLLWDLDTAPRPRAGDWPAFRRDAAHTGTQTAGGSCTAARPPGQFYTVAPCRVFDSRLPAAGGPLLSGQERLVRFGGACGVPLDAIAVAVNVTVVPRGAGGNVALGPACSPLATSTVNFGPAAVRANNAVLPLAGAAAALRARATVGGEAGVDLVVDVAGYFR